MATDPVYAEKRRVRWLTKNISEERRVTRNESARNRSPEYDRRVQLKFKYKITPEDYQAKFDAQGGLCAICGRPETQMRDGKLLWLPVDHEHAKPKGEGDRDLLCASCNVMNGSFERPEWTAKALAYLLKHKSIVLLEALAQNGLMLTEKSEASP